MSTLCVTTCSCGRNGTDKKLGLQMKESERHKYVRQLMESITGKIFGQESTCIGNSSVTSESRDARML